MNSLPHVQAEALNNRRHRLSGWRHFYFLKFQRQGLLYGLHLCFLVTVFRVFTEVCLFKFPPQGPKAATWCFWGWKCRGNGAFGRSKNTDRFPCTVETALPAIFTVNTAVDDVSPAILAGARQQARVRGFFVTQDTPLATVCTHTRAERTDDASVERAIGPQR